MNLNLNERKISLCYIRVQLNKNLRQDFSFRNFDPQVLEEKTSRLLRQNRN